MSDLPGPAGALIETGRELVRRSSSGRALLARIADLVPQDRWTPDLADAHAAAREPVAPGAVRRALKDAWGRPPDRVLDAFDPEPVAATATAQVHRGKHDGRPVAVKVRRAGLTAAVRSDLALLDVLAVPLARVLPAADTGAAVRELREMTLDELDLEHVASTQRQVRRALRAVEGVVVPAPQLALCTEDVLVTEWLDGEPAPAAERRRLAGRLLAAHEAAARAGLVLVDPRPGHVLALRDGRLGLLGAGVARPIDRDRAAAALDALHALRDQDADTFAAATADRLGLLPRDRADEAHTLLTAVHSPEEAADRAGDLLALAAVATPAPGDVAVARCLLQLAAVVR